MKSQGFNPFSSNYRNIFGNSYIRQFDVYDNHQERIGQVMDVRVNEAGHFQYLVVNLVAPANKQVLVPLSQTEIDPQKRRIHMQELSKDQVLNLSAYIPAATQSPQSSNSSPPAIMPLEASAPLETAISTNDRRAPDPTSTVSQPTLNSDSNHPSAQVNSYQFDTYSSDRLNDSLQLPLQTENGTTIRLHEERLVVDRGKRRKIGEVIVRKEIETRMVEVPVRYEKLIVEQVSPDYQQLAIVDLKPDPADFAAVATDSSAQASVSGEFTSAEAASRFLDAIAHYPSAGHRTIQIRIMLKDAAEQATYQAWLERYLGQ